MDWLSELEKQVRAAAAELASLRKQNRTLKAKVKKLETSLAEGGGGEGEPAWERQRGDLRRRVEKLADGLEKLL